MSAIPEDIRPNLADQEPEIRRERRRFVHPDHEAVPGLPKAAEANEANTSLWRKARDWVFGENGGARYSDLEKLTDRKGLSDYLPWKLYRREDDAYLIVNNTVGYCWECTPVAFAGLDEVKQIESLIRADFPKDTVIQFIMYGDHDVTGFVDAFKRNKTRDDELVRKNITEYSNYLERGAEGIDKCHNIPLRNFRLFVTLYSKNELTEDIISITEEMLTGAHLQPRKLPVEGLVAFMRNLLNGRKFGGSIGTFDESLPIRKQIINADTDIDFSRQPYRIGNMHAKCLTPKANPKRVDPLKANTLLGGFRGVAEDAEQIGSPFLWTCSIVFDDLKFTLHNKASLTMTQKSGGSFAAAIARRTEEFGWALDKFESDRFVTVVPTFWIFDEDAKRLRDSASRVKRIWESKDFVMQEESILSKILLIASLPFGLYTDNGNVSKMERSFVAHAAAVARYVPIQGDFRGASDPVLAFIGRKGQHIGIDVFDKRSNNHNFIVSAESGSGKSFTLNNLCGNYYATGAMIRIVDIGYSYQKLCSTCSGRFMDYGRERPVTNPFMVTAKDAEDEERNKVAAANIVAEMAYSASGGSLSETEWTLIKAAVESTIKSGNVERGIDYVVEFLREFPKLATDIDPSEDLEFARTRAQELAFNLRDFTSKGQYGEFFNGPSTFDIASDEFVVLELDQLKGVKELFTVVVMQVMNSVTQDLYLSDRGERRFILFEEAASFLKQNGAHDLSRLATMIEEGFRRARKYRGSFGVVLQSMVDLDSFGSIGDVLVNNGAYKFMLQGKDYAKAIDLGLIDYEGLAVDLLTSIRNNKPRYSELFLDTPFGAGIGRLVVDPWNYWVNTSDGGDIAKYMQLREQGKTPIQAISDLSGIPVS